MKINTSMRKDIMTFAQLMIGDVFEYNGNYFMKLPVSYTDGALRNAVRLENGWLVKFTEIDSVRYIDAELVI